MWFSSMSSLLRFGTGRTRSRRRPSYDRRAAARRRLVLELLEDRCLLSTYTVNTVADNGDNVNPIQGSLRWAILQADSNSGSSLINFNICSTSPSSSGQCQMPSTEVIMPPIALPAVTANNVTIDARPGLEGNPMGQMIEINGAFAGNAYGLELNATTDEVDGLSVVNFIYQAGILVGGQNDTISESYLGTDFTGDPGLGNGSGILFGGSQGSVVEASTISGNIAFGVEMSADSSDTLHGNDIGVLSDDITPLPNGTQQFGGDGVLIINAVGDALLSNLIFFNYGDGVAVSLSAGITIGFDALTANTILRNTGDGIDVLQEMSNTSQTFNTSIAHNDIYGNLQNGIHLAGSSNNMISSNTIGTDREVDPNVGNAGDGVRIESPLSSTSTKNLIENNSIAGNDGNGVTLTDSGTSMNSLFQNLIGLCAPEGEGQPPPIPLGNLQDGVAILSGANNNMVGGTGLHFFSMGQGNVISANGGDGVALSGFGTNLNNVQGNLIGTYTDGERSVIVTNKGNLSTANGLHGVGIGDNARNNLVGGTGNPAAASGQGNVISGNTLDGVFITDAGTNLNVLQGNFIGTDASGTAKLKDASGIPRLSNGGDGVAIEDAASFNTVGGSQGLLSNVISGNNNNGLFLTNGASANQVQLNFIGTDLSGANAVANEGDGVYISGGANANTIGGVSGAVTLGNVISGNQVNGLGIDGNGTTGNMVQANDIGTTFGGLQGLPNLLDGVFLSNGAAQNTIGGSPSAANLISGNGEAGVASQSNGGNTVQDNFIGTDSTYAAALGNGTDGVDLFGNGDMLLGNVISGNHAAGVALEGSQNVVQANEIGTNRGGTGAVANLNDGVFMDVLAAVGGNTVGGTAAGAGNLISGNDWNGIEITGPANASNIIEGNDIGTMLGGASALPNLRNGILISGTSGYVIGGTGAGTGNVISGNMQNGVQISGSFSFGNVLLGNNIGTDPSGTIGVPNQGNGVDILNGASKNMVGGTAGASGPANLISGNQLSGVVINGGNNNFLEGNFIGTKVSGLDLLGNKQNGVDIIGGSTNNQIGGFGGVGPGGQGNLISGNGSATSGDGVLIAHAGTANTLFGNDIGTDRYGSAVGLGNVGNGVHILSTASNYVGTPAQGNLISGNGTVTGGDGVRIEGDGAIGNVVQLNKIGTDITGSVRLSNGGNGVNLLANVIDTMVSSNLISGNEGSGVAMTANSKNQVQMNFIGSTALGTGSLGNGGDGVDIFNGANNNQVGGTGNPASGGAGNLIAANARGGVVLSGSGTASNKVQGNFIGTTASGSGRLGNLGDGVDILNAAAVNLIGGSSGFGPNGQGNLISGNMDGVHIIGTDTNSNSIQGNRIGTDLTGQVAVGNQDNGVYVAQFAKYNVISSNLIAFNVKVGVVIGGSAGDAGCVSNAILSNSIHHNGALGIDLGDNGFTLNTLGGPHMGPNDFQNFPIIGVPRASSSSTIIPMFLNSIPKTSFIIQIFANPAPDPSGYGQGQNPINTPSPIVVTTGPSGNIKFSVTVPQDLAGQYLCATATVASGFPNAGDTSEFSKDSVKVHDPPVLPVLPALTARPDATSATTISPLSANPAAGSTAVLALTLFDTPAASLDNTVTGPVALGPSLSTPSQEGSQSGAGLFDAHPSAVDQLFASLGTASRAALLFGSRSPAQDGWWDQSPSDVFLDPLGGPPPHAP